MGLVEEEDRSMVAQQRNIQLYFYIYIHIFELNWGVVAYTRQMPAFGRFGWRTRVQTKRERGSESINHHLDSHPFVSIYYRWPFFSSTPTAVQTNLVLRLSLT